MADPFIGEVRIMAFNFAPIGWAFCNGAVMSPQQNPALYSILGNTYGGTYPNTFQLPNLQADAVVGAGQGPGLSTYPLGSTSGASSVTLAAAGMPSHTHQSHVQVAKTANEYAGTPAAASYLALGVTSTNSGTTFAPLKEFLSTADSQFSGATISPNGKNLPHENRQPFLTLNFCIALEGIYPIHS